MAPDAEATQIAISVVETPMPDPAKSASCTLSKWRRPSPETAPTDAKAVCLYAQAGRASAEAKSKGFDEGVMLDPLGHVAEFASANLWIAKDGEAHTPDRQWLLPRGITRARVIELLRKAGIQVYERTLDYQDLLDADEIFSTGNFGKVMPYHEDRRPLTAAGADLPPRPRPLLGIRARRVKASPTEHRTRDAGDAKLDAGSSSPLPSGPSIVGCGLMKVLMSSGMTAEHEASDSQRSASRW